jgi:type IV fimbrial biogenesis protein FimT
MLQAVMVKPFEIHCGFTTIELLVVLVVAAVLAALAGPSFTTYFATQRLKSSAGELSTDFQFSRQEAVQRNSVITVTMAATGYTVAQGATQIKNVTFANGSSVSGGSTMVAAFDPVRGETTLTNGPSVTVSNTGISGTLRVSLNTLGRVSMCSPGGAIKGYDAC